MKTALIIGTLLSSVVMASVAHAGQPLPAGDPQEARYRKLLQRWNTPTGCENRAIGEAERKRAEAMRPVLEKMTPLERKNFEIRSAASRETWESLSPKQQAKVLEQARSRFQKQPKISK